MFFRKKNFYICLVCGYDRLPGPLYNKKGIPNESMICTCCGFQPGYDDDEEIGNSLEEYRENWIQTGAKWFKEKKRPKQWDLNQQLKNI